MTDAILEAIAACQRAEHLKATPLIVGACERCLGYAFRKQRDAGQEEGFRIALLAASQAVCLHCRDMGRPQLLASNLNPEQKMWVHTESSEPFSRWPCRAETIQALNAQGGA